MCLLIFGFCTMKEIPLSLAKLTAACSVLNLICICPLVSLEPVQPINGSIVLAKLYSHSMIQIVVWAVPDCIADFAGLKILATISNS